MAMLNRKQLNLPEDGQEALFLLPWTERAWDSLKAELGRDGLVTEKAAQQRLEALLDRLRYICADVFKAEKNALIVEAAPFMALDPGLATMDMKAAASEKLLRELERTGGGCIFEKYPPLRGLLDCRTELFTQACLELLQDSEGTGRRYAAVFRGRGLRSGDGAPGRLRRPALSRPEHLRCRHPARAVRV